jgi:hypothetical protein
VVTSAAVAAVRSVTSFSSSAGYQPSQADPDPAEVAAETRAVDAARASLGGYGRETTFAWMPAPAGEVELRVAFHLSGTSFGLVHLPLLNDFTRTVRARVEQIVCPPDNQCTVVEGGASPVGPSGGVGGP